MAKRHVVQYFLELENTYVEMQDTVKELQQLAQEGKVEESAYLDAKKDIETIKQNYERVAYIIYLLNKPNRKTKEEKQVETSWYNCLKTSSKEAIVDETKDALSHFKGIVEELKQNG